MSANNNNIFNAALSGAAAGVASRWLTNTSSASYDPQSALVTQFATLFDAAIDPVAGGGSRGQCAVVSDICSAFWRDRVLTSDTNLESAVQPLVALYQSLATDVLPDAGGGGGGGTTPLVLQFTGNIPSIDPDNSNTITIDVAAPGDLGTRTIASITGFVMISPTVAAETQGFGDTGLGLSWSTDAGANFQDDPFTQFQSFITADTGQTSGQFNYPVSWAPTESAITDTVQLKMQVFNFGVSTIPITGVYLYVVTFTDAP